MAWDQNRLSLLLIVRNGYCSDYSNYDSYYASLLDLKIHRQFLLQGGNGILCQSGFFYMALSLTLGGCLLVNS